MWSHLLGENNSQHRRFGKIRKDVIVLLRNLFQMWFIYFSQNVVKGVLNFSIVPLYKFRYFVTFSNCTNLFVLIHREDIVWFSHEWNMNLWWFPNGNYTQQHGIYFCIENLWLARMKVICFLDAHNFWELKKSAIQNSIQWREISKCYFLITMYN
jgi:hypothetical protein